MKVFIWSTSKDWLCIKIRLNNDHFLLWYNKNSTLAYASKQKIHESHHPCIFNTNYIIMQKD
jgi:hypothetical protein